MQQVYKEDRHQISMKEVACAEIQYTRKQKEQRRLFAAEDFARGMKAADVARKYNVHRSSASRWKRDFEEEGKKGLASQKGSGRPTKLSDQQKVTLADFLVEGAQKYGFETDLWTSKRVVKLIKKEFGINYHFNHIPKLLHALDFRPIKPAKQAAEKDENKKKEWLKTTWVKLKKT